MSGENDKNLSEKEQKKISGNAISAYLLIFVSVLFLFNKKKYIDNSFVKNHVHSAFLIHIGFVFTYIIFISNGLFDSIGFLGFTLNNIIASLLSLGLLGLLIYGIYKAYNYETFSLGEIIKIVNKETLIDVNGDNIFDEKDKLTIILAYIPLIGYFNHAEYEDNEVINNATNFNVSITIIISLLYISGYGNLGMFLSLFYIIFIVFISINLFTTQKLIEINTKFFPTPQKIYVLFFTLIKYLQEYFTEKQSLDFHKLQKEIQEKNKLQQKTGSHFINGIMLTLVLFLNGILSYFNIIINLNLFILFIFSFWVGYLYRKKGYRIPFIYDIYSFCHNIIKGGKDFHKKYNKDVESSFKIKE